MKFTLEPRDGLLWVTATGQASVIDVVEIFKKAFDASVGRGSDLILVDCSAVTGALSVLQRFDLGVTAARYAREKPRVFKVAVIGHPPVIDGFAALVASNRGVTAQVFCDPHDAVAWLSRFNFRQGTRSCQLTRTGSCLSQNHLFLTDTLGGSFRVCRRRHI